MCFSATASFSAAASLIGLCMLTLKSASRPRELLFGAIPLLFAIQQRSVGAIWLSFRRGAPLLNGSICDLAAESGSYAGCSRDPRTRAPFHHPRGGV